MSEIPCQCCGIYEKGKDFTMLCQPCGKAIMRITGGHKIIFTRRAGEEHIEVCFWKHATQVTVQIPLAQVALHAEIERFIS